MSNIDWENKHNRKILLKEIEKAKLHQDKMLKENPNFYDVPHPSKRMKRWWMFWKK